VVELASDNPGWGYAKIRDALRGLKIEMGRTTVATLLAQAGIEPAPERNRKRTWKQFLRNHWETLYACDFFSVEVLGVFGMVRHMAFSSRCSRVPWRPPPSASLRTGIG
jgi:hypothetical protein